MVRFGVLGLLLILPGVAGGQQAKNAALPNIVWITSEDHGPHLGCYGDALARTPNLDKLAQRGLRFRLAWSNAPVCAPARTAIITGVYPTASGSHHMRSLTALPGSMRMFPHYLRLAGYYCTNCVKEDYNLAKTKDVWDASSAKAHWKNRRRGQPFFAVFNSTRSHESQLRGYKNLVTKPGKVPIPAYHPDTPETRRDWARYYDVVALADEDAGAVLRELEEAGLLEDTIVFYFADHGSGMPRNKRTPLSSGLHVPMIVSFPERWRHLAPRGYQAGGTSDRLVSFVDLAPTMLSLAGLEAPDWMQGRAFAGVHAKDAPEYLHGFRDRMDSRYDLQRSVTDGRFVYLKNYNPHLAAGQYVDYMFQTRTTQTWWKLHEDGKLNAAQDAFWRSPRPPEELYDLQSDRDEVHNLAMQPQHQQTLNRLREAQRRQVLAIRDVALLPEDEMHARATSTPYELGQDPRALPLERILKTAEAASSLQDGELASLREALSDADSGVRYWGALGLLMRGPEALMNEKKLLTAALRDASPSVRIVAAEGMVLVGDDGERGAGLQVLRELASPAATRYQRLQALNALDRLAERLGLAALAPILPALREWPAASDSHRAAAGTNLLVSSILGRHAAKRGGS